MEEETAQERGEYVIDFQNEENEEAQKSQIRFTILESGKWAPLIYLDEIKERNKPTNLGVDAEKIKIPFFLDFDNIEQTKKQVHEEIAESIKQQSKIIKKEREKYLAELGSGIEKILHVKDATKLTAAKIGVIAGKLLAELKTMTPAQIDYELRQSCFGNLGNVELMLKVFLHLFEDPDEFDLKNVYFNDFIKVAFSLDSAPVLNTLPQHARLPLELLVTLTPARPAELLSPTHTPACRFAAMTC